jgi:hypothetical protein
MVHGFVKLLIPLNEERAIARFRKKKLADLCARRLTQLDATLSMEASWVDNPP